MKIFSEIQALTMKMRENINKFNFECIEEPPIRIRMIERNLRALERKLSDSQRIFSETPVCEFCKKKL